MRYVKEAWHSISTKTIKNVFRKAKIIKFAEDEQATARLSGHLHAVNDVSEQISDQSMEHEEANANSFDIFALIRDVDGLRHITRDDVEQYIHDADFPD